MEKEYVQKDSCHCLECGNDLGYGRTDRKFCSAHCRYEYHNHKTRPSLLHKLKVVEDLEKNYSILRGLADDGVDSISLAQLSAMGFDPSTVTKAVRVKRHYEMGVFDIHYTQSDTRIYGIKIVSVPLRHKIR